MYTYQLFTAMLFFKKKLVQSILERGNTSYSSNNNYFSTVNKQTNISGSSPPTPDNLNLLYVVCFVVMSVDWFMLPVCLIRMIEDFRHAGY